MKILHVSDTHGHFDPLVDLDTVDVVVHSGDLLPNRSFAIRPIEESFQRYWLEEHKYKLSTWLGGKSLIYCAGNHDYVDPAPILGRVGVNVHNITAKSLSFKGVNFYGVPWVPLFAGWNYEVNDREMHELLKPAVSMMNNGDVDVLVAHSPIYGILDRNAKGERCGSRVLRDLLRNVRKPPKYLLHGHIHERGGEQQTWSKSITCVNAATTQVIIDVCDTP